MENDMRVLSMREPVPLTDIYTHVNILERITAYDGKTLEELEKSFDSVKRSFGIVKEEAKPGIQVANELQKFILLGKPGSGKTTFLKVEDRPSIGGLLLWLGKENFLRLVRGIWGDYEISFAGCLENEDLVIGRGRLLSHRAFLRLERVGNRVNALCSSDDEE